MILTLFADVLIYMFLAFGLWFLLKVLKYPDLSIEQIFVLGGVVFGISSNADNHFTVTLSIVFVIALILSIICSFLRFKIKLNPIIISLIMTYVYYSTSLYLMGKSGISIKNISDNNEFNYMMYSIILLITYSFFLFFLFKSKFGLRIISIGSNEILANRLSISPFKYGTAGLFFAYFIILMGGVLYAYRIKNADISYGGGFLLMSLFIVLLTNIISKRINVFKILFAILLVSLLYSLLLQIIITINFPSELTRGFYAISLLVLVIAMPRDKMKLFS